MSKFRSWYVRNQDAITWFVIGILTMSTLDYAAKQEWLWAVFCAALIAVNYKFRNFRLK